MKIALDAFGSDTCPEPELEGAIEAVTANPGLEILLVGKVDILSEKLSKLNTKGLPITLVDAPDIVEMTDKPSEAAMKKPLNSMAVGLNLVKSREASAFVTAGNTGAAFFNAVKILRPMKGIMRPALTTTLPTRKERVVFLDTGANVDCRPEFLLEFGIMGSAYAQAVLGRENPRVALLANGEEEGKGTQVVKEAYHLLAQSGLNFIGNIEPKEVYAGHADVVVADGFAGNVFIKTSEAVGKMITDLLKEEMLKNFTRKLGAMLIKPGFGRLKKMMDPSETGAALLMGMNGLVFIGHGRSNAHAIASAVKLAKTVAERGLIDTIQSDILSKLN